MCIRDSTRTEIEVSKSVLGPEQLERRLRDSLLGKGWKTRASSAAGLGVYTRGRDVLTVRIANRDGERIITRIYKKGAASTR